MNCGECQREVPAEARFCMHCGAALAVACGSCGAAVSLTARYCSACGQERTIPAETRESTGDEYTPRHLRDGVLRAPSEVRGERKRVTILFADVKSSVELSEQLDAEVWHAVLDRFFAILTQDIHRYEGTVNQYTGDGIMAIFGAPKAQEDHAQRACCAALQMRNELAVLHERLAEEHGIDFRARMGLNSGEVIVGTIGTGLRFDYTAKGHTVGMAARMEQLAAPGEVYLAEATARLVDGYFDLEALGEQPIRGSREPQRVYRLRGPGPLLSRLDRARTQRLSPLVGRNAELRWLEEAYDRVAQGAGSIVGVSAEAGLGKSRLCFEFEERALGRGAAVYGADCRARGETRPLAPVVALLRAICGAGADDRCPLLREKLERAVAERDPSLAADLPLLRDFLGASEGPEPDLAGLDAHARRRRLLRCGLQLLEIESRSHPVVLLIEDLHWADIGTLAFLEQLARFVEEMRVLVLVTYRPEFRAPWMGHPAYESLAIPALDAVEARELVAHRLGSDPSVEALTPPLVGWSGGNPFFIEEMIRSLADAGRLEGRRGAYRLTGTITDLPIPETVQSALEARIDRLQDPARRALRAAAIAGSEFDEALLQEVTGMGERPLREALLELKKGEFIHEQALFPGPTYGFQHPLTRDVAYEGQLVSVRARGHRDVAEALERLHADELDDYAATIAVHWDLAGERDGAVRWHLRAAQREAMLQPTSAVERLRRIRNLLPNEPEDTERAIQGLTARSLLLYHGARTGLLLQEIETLLDEGLALAERIGDPGRRVTFVLLAWLAMVQAGQSQQARALARDGMADADARGDAMSRFLARLAVLQGFVATGRLDDAWPICEAALELSGYRRDPEASGLAYRLLVAQANLLVRAGRPLEAMPIFDEGLRRAADAGDHMWSIVGESGVSRAELALGNAVPALERAERATALAERTGAPADRCVAIRALGAAQLACGKATQARETLLHGLRIARDARTLLHEELMLAELADAQLAAGEVEEARRTAREAAHFSHTRENDVLEMIALLAEARALLAGPRPKPAAAERALDRAEAIVEATGTRVYAPDLHLARAWALSLAGDFEGAGRERALAEQLLAEMGALARAKALATRGAEAAGP
jgi:class 3 adenylate cyclase/tetratricopeptide (TPR) repeat protein